MTAELDQPTLDAARAALRFDHVGPLIDGHEVDDDDLLPMPCVDPSTERTVAEVRFARARHVELAVSAARAAFSSGVWARRSPAERKAGLLALAGVIERHAVELAVLESLDTGKPIKNAFFADVQGALRSLRWYAEAVDKVYGQIAPTPHDVLALVTREPVGVVAALVPWNFPLYQTILKLGPALAAGNSIILKPAEQAPLTVLRIARLALEAGIPPGVVQVLPGAGEEVGQALGRHRGVDLLSFTGSTAVGKLQLRYSGESNMKRLILECGGKSPNLVLPDFDDLELAAEKAVEGAFYNQGQVCCSPANLIVHEDRAPRLIELVREASRAYRPDDPSRLATSMGALISAPHLSRVLDHVARGRAEGARLVTGGERLPRTGYFVPPTIFCGVDPGMSIAREEIFGPVLSVLTYRTLEQALAIANGTGYGLAAFLWTHDVARVHQVSRALQVGFVSVNAMSSGDVTTPFGGFKESGLGRERSLSAIESYCETKTTWISTGTGSH